MTIPVLNLIRKEQSLTLPVTTISLVQLSRQLRTTVSVLEGDVLGALGKVDAAPEEPSYVR